MNCLHNNLYFSRTLDPTAEAPYDGTDEYWEVFCEDCEKTIADGDGYDTREAIKLKVKTALTKAISQ